MKKYLLTAISIIFLVSASLAQGYWFGVKGGVTLSNQLNANWLQSSGRSPIWRYHIIGFIESAPETNEFALFAQLGYHVKGSQIRFNATTINIPGQGLRNIPARKIPAEFNNLSLTIGAKQKFDVGGSYNKMYYLFGIRGDYTLNTQLRPPGVDENDICHAVLYPLDRYVRNFVFGMTAGGGFEFPFSEYVGGLIEFTINPDFTLAYDAPQIPVDLCYFGSGSSTIPERQFRTITLEITFGIHFLHRIEYIDTSLF